IGGVAPMSMSLVRGETTPPALDPTLSGTLAAAKLISGARGRTGSLRGAPGLAPRPRHAAPEGGCGHGRTGRGHQRVRAAHARLDWHATPGLSLGAIAGMDLLDTTNLLFGIELGFHMN